MKEKQKNVVKVFVVRLRDVFGKRDILPPPTSTWTLLQNKSVKDQPRGQSKTALNSKPKMNRTQKK